MLLEEIHSSLGLRVVIWMSLVLMLILGAITIMNTEQQTLMMMTKEKQAAIGLSNAILIALRHPMLNGDQDIIQEQFNYFSKLKELKGLILSDAEGVIKRSTDINLIGTTAADLKPYISYFQKNSGDVHVVENFPTTNEKVFSDIMPIRNEAKCWVCHSQKKEILGVLKISLEWEKILTEINSIKNRNIVISLFGILAIGGLSIAFLLRSIVYPIKKLERGMSNVAQGNLEVNIENKSKDEIGKLTQMFNKMTQDLKELMQKEKAFVAAQQKRAAELASSLSLLNATLESTTDGMLVVNRQGRVTSFNEKFVHMWKIPKEIIEARDDGKVLEHILDKLKDPDKELKRIVELYNNPELNSFDVLEFMDGKIFERYSQPQRMENKIVGRVWSFRDITERRKAEEELKEKSEELERSNADLQQFAYVSSHDLQEPLRMVAGYVKLLERRYKNKLDADAEEFISFAVEGAQRMSELINDLLAYSRVNSQGSELKPTDTKIAFEKALFNLQGAIQESQVTITHGELPKVMGDATQLMQLFQNLIGNALKFKGQDPLRVHVQAERDGKKWVFSVSDNGMGIKEDYFERIFIIFQRLHNRAEYPGTGIGLSLCKRIVERHEGRIWIKSKLGEGTTFYFSLKPVGGEEV